MDELTKDYIMIGINIVVALTAIIAVYSSRIISRNQLRREKLEEIYRLFNKLMSTYESLFNLFTSVNKYHVLLDKRAEIQKKYEEDKKTFMNRYDVDKLIEDYYTLDMLVKLYTKGKLKKKMMSLCLLYIDLFDTAFNFQYLTKEIFWSKGYPIPNEMNILFRSLEENMIKGLGMTNKASLYTKEDVRKYCNNDLKKDLEKIKILTRF